MPLPSTRFRALRSYEADPHYANSQYGELLVSERTPILSLSPAFPISTLLNTTSTNGGATITKTSAEYRLNLTASGGDSVTLETAQRGVYMPGYSAQVGVGIRIPAAPTGNQRIIWGYADANDGIYFGVDATGMFVARKRGGVEQIWRQANWSADKLDGTGASQYTLDLSHGNIFHMDFSWYGYGTIEWKVIITDEYGRQQSVTVHRFTPTDELSILQPNLPISVSASNGGTATALDVYIAGRQFSIKGQYRPMERITCHRVLSKAVTTALTPIMTFRHNPSSPPAEISIEGFDLITDQNVLITIHSDATLGGTPSFGAPIDIPSTETVMEVDTSATSFSGGTAIYSSLVGPTSGNGAGHSLRRNGAATILPPRPFTFSVRGISQSATISLVVRMLEGW